ncbi:hypothetical protein GCM10009595_08420 [Falsarthrobacter nasiphocae]
MNQRSDPSPASLRRGRRELVRKALKGYDLDHKVDLQFGGKDRVDDLQRLDQSVNRGVGAQLRWKVGSLEARKFARQSAVKDAPPATPVTEFHSN